MVIIIAAALLFSPHSFLTLRNRDTGELYGRYPMKEGERFSVEFKHSINLSPVIDVYQIEDGNIYVGRRFTTTLARESRPSSTRERR